MDKDRYHSFGDSNPVQNFDGLRPGEPISRDPIFIVLEGSPAWDLLLRAAQQGWRPGEVFRASQKELDSFRTDVIIINGTMS